VAESLNEQIAVALQAKLASIVGDGGASYWYTPTVIRTPGVSAALLDLDVATTAAPAIYAVIPDEEEHLEEASGLMQAYMKIYLFLAVRFQPDKELPFDQSAPIRWTVQNRMVRDVLKKLLTDLTLGGLVLNLFGGPGDRVLIDRSARTYEDGWAIVFVHFRIFYGYQFGAP
jgi:hypothetical protein